MNLIKEKSLIDYPGIVSLESTEIIIKQMKKNIIKIHLDDGTKATGFFCKIPFNNNKEIKVLITNNHVTKLKEDKLTITINNDSEIKEIELKDRIKYTNEEYDITIIEIKEKDNIENFLELDENIMKKGSNKIYNNNTIYILQYPEGDKLGASYGILKIYEENLYNFRHYCSTKKGSSGSPIINIKNNKVIGLHKEAGLNYNQGLFLNIAIEDFINKNNKNNKIIKNNNEIIMNNKNNKIIINYRNNIKELNEAFNLNLKDNDNLEKLDLSEKGISNIEILEKLEIYNLEELNLSWNLISDIKVLEKVKFYNLKELNLADNEISDIKLLENVKLINLEILYLNRNLISDIKVLVKVKFYNLKEYI